MLAYRRSKNLRDLLISAHLKPLPTKDASKTHACTLWKKHCKACYYVLDTTSFHSVVTCQTFKILQDIIATLQISSTSSPVAALVSNSSAKPKGGTTNLTKNVHVLCSISKLLTAFGKMVYGSYRKLSKELKTNIDILVAPVVFKLWIKTVKI